ncbi:MAG: PEP-CTERM sorting domain-containing protein [Phycisphaerales bacterium]|nr:PEP-CTERM sorting domain-containing protein [Phycisphaerales bacterium]
MRYGRRESGGPYARLSRLFAAVTLTVAIGAGQHVVSAQNRSIDGTGNNVANPNWGSADTQLLRLGSSDYGDGISTPAGASRASPRAISNAVAHQTGSILNNRNLTDYVWQWGQFLDHDIDLTAGASPAEPFDIAVPAGDAWFDPFNTGVETIGMNRSVYDAATGTGVGNPRQQLNQITSYIDASNVYGSDATRAAALRTFSGGKLATSSHATGDLLPFNTGLLPNANDAGIVADQDLFLAGDVRANEQTGLTAMHTLFVREHNRLADEIALANPGFNDEQIYQQARKIVGAQMQAITYNEFLPALLGSGAVSGYTGYSSTVDAGVSNEFSTAAYRLGHSMLSTTLKRPGNGAGDLSLADAFFNPNRITAEGGIDSVLKGLASQEMQEIDTKIVGDVRNFLFGPPGSGGLDLASLNLQRGRDHGLQSYNQARVDMGLAPVATFADITSDVAVQTALASVYASVNDIDLWIGGLAEDHLPGSSVGELINAILVDQFERLRDGDRFWYENDPFFNAQLLAEINGTTLAEIIARNTNVTGLQGNVFFIPEPGTLLLLGFGAGLLLRRRRNR